MIARVHVLALAGALAATAALAGSSIATPTHAEPLRFAVVGHLRGSADGEAYYRLEELLEAVEAAEPAFLVLTGDLIWGSYTDATVDRAAINANWESLDAVLGGLPFPVYRVPGNHDVNDAVTRDVWLARYGEPSRVVDHGATRVVLLSSVVWPEGDAPPPLPRAHTRPPALGPGAQAVLRDALASPGAYERAFVFLHHLLWWQADAPWWQQVHPLLVEGKVRAVFGGDFGPLKFSHQRRDGIDYVQSAVEGPSTNTRLLRNLEGSRLLHFQLDNFLVVTANADGVDVDVRVVGALSSGKYTPDRFREIFAPRPMPLGERVSRALGGPLRRALLAVLTLGCLGLGWLLGRRRG